jgi:hypothetical protein
MMKRLPEKIKIIFYLTFLWALFGLSFTLYVIQVDQGLFAGIAIPFLFLLGQIILGSTLTLSIFRTHRDVTNPKFRIITLIISILPIILTIILVPLLGS